MNELLKEKVKSLAFELGFAKVGIARVKKLERESNAFHEWLRSEYHGQMQWMANTADVRVSPDHEKMVDGACSVITFAMPYAHPHDSALFWGQLNVARYAKGRDYHRVISKKLRKVEEILSSAGFVARAAVDTKPVLERAWAQRSGIGFVGKNACLIVPGFGSHVFLACVITTAELPEDKPMEERCGECTKCLEACPTNAFVSERILDARRCISYLTIENEGSIPLEFRKKIYPWVFGCDVCQDVCPYNQGSGRNVKVDESFSSSTLFSSTTPEDILLLTQEELKTRLQGSALARTGPQGIARNIIIAMGGSKNKRYLPILNNFLTTQHEPINYESAEWSKKQIEQED